MDNSKTGKLILALRKEKQMTQKELAEQLGVTDKAISKWERGLGCPDVSLLPELSAFFGVNMEELLSGDLAADDPNGGNMKNTRFYVCPICSNISVCTGNASVSCCGRKLEQLTPKKAEMPQCLLVEVIEEDWFITSDHAMTKDEYISFLAFVTGDRLQLIKQYPEWDLQVRIPKRGHGMLIWYSTKDGLLYQLL